MRNLILFAALMSMPAYAAKPPAPAPQGQHQGQSQSAASESDAAATSASTATSASASSATQSQSATASNSGNAQAINYEDRLQAPSVFAPAVYASGPCNTGWSAGASGPGAGLSFGKSKTDPACDRRELARVLTPLNPQLALKILCADPIAKEVSTEQDCTYVAPPDTSKPTVVILQDTGATDEKIRRAFEKSQGK